MLVTGRQEATTASSGAPGAQSAVFLILDLPGPQGAPTMWCWRRWAFPGTLCTPPAPQGALVIYGRLIMV